MFFLAKKLILVVPIIVALSLIGCDATKSKLSPAGPIKWHPGHYVRIFRGTNLKAFISKIENEPYVKGVQVMHGWPELEKSEGVYDFSVIEDELAILKAHDKYMILQVIDKTFNSQYLPCVPEYLLNDPVYQGGQSISYKAQTVFKNCVALRWVPEVQDRLIALYAALGTRFDNDPTLEAVMTEEGAITAYGDKFQTYSKSAYVAQQKRGMEGLAHAFQNTVAYQLINWGGKEIGDLFEHAYRLGIGIGGPDLLPTHHPTAYRFYSEYAGKMPLQISVQVPGINKYIRQGHVDLEKAFDFGLVDPNGLRVNHIIWDGTEKYPETSFVNQIIPLINRHKGYINEALPANRRR